MKQFLTVLKFELNNYFKNKSFLLTTIILIVLAVGIIALPGIITAVEGGSSASEESTVETEESSGESSEETVALLDENGSIADPEAFSAAMGMNICGIIEQAPVRNEAMSIRWKLCVRAIVKREKIRTVKLTRMIFFR